MYMAARQKLDRLMEKLMRFINDNRPAKGEREQARLWTADAIDALFSDRVMAAIGPRAFKLAFCDVAAAAEPRVFSFGAPPAAV